MIDLRDKYKYQRYMGGVKYPIQPTEEEMKEMLKTAKVYAYNEAFYSRKGIAEDKETAELKSWELMQENIKAEQAPFNRYINSLTGKTQEEQLAIIASDVNSVLLALEKKDFLEIADIGKARTNKDIESIKHHIKRLELYPDGIRKEIEKLEEDPAAEAKLKKKNIDLRKELKAVENEKAYIKHDHQEYINSCKERGISPASTALEKIVTEEYDQLKVDPKKKGVQSEISDLKKEISYYKERVKTNYTKNFTSYANYLLGQIPQYLKALERFDLPQNEIMRLVSEMAGKGYKSPNKEPAMLEVYSKSYSSPAIQAINLTNQNDFIYDEINGELKYSPNENFTFSLQGMDNTMKAWKPASKKIFAILLMKAAQEMNETGALRDTSLTKKEYITYSEKLNSSDLKKGMTESYDDFMNAHIDIRELKNRVDPSTGAILKDKKITESGMNIFSKVNKPSEIKEDDTVEVTWNADMVDYLSRAPIKRINTEYLKIPDSDKHTVNIYYILRYDWEQNYTNPKRHTKPGKLARYNLLKPIEGIIKADTNFPSIEKAKANRQVNRDIITPFIKTIKELKKRNLFMCEFCNSQGNKIDIKKVEQMKYDEFIELYIAYRPFKDYPENIEEKIDTAKKRATEREATKEKRKAENEADAEAKARVKAKTSQPESEGTEELSQLPKNINK